MRIGDSGKGREGRDYEVDLGVATPFPRGRVGVPPESSVHAELKVGCCTRRLDYTGLYDGIKQIGARRRRPAICRKVLEMKTPRRAGARRGALENSRRF